MSSADTSKPCCFGTLQQKRAVMPHPISYHPTFWAVGCSSWGKQDLLHQGYISNPTPQPTGQDHSSEARQEHTQMPGGQSAVFAVPADQPHSWQEWVLLHFPAISTHPMLPAACPAELLSTGKESTKSWLGPGRRRAACPCSPWGTHESPSPPQTRSKGWFSPSQQERDFLISSALEKRVEELRMKGALPAARLLQSLLTPSQSPGPCSSTLVWLISSPASESEQLCVTFPSLLRIFLTDWRTWQGTKYSLTSTLTIVSFGKAQLPGCREQYRLLLQPAGTAVAARFREQGSGSRCTNTALTQCPPSPITYRAPGAATTPLSSSLLDKVRGLNEQKWAH